MAATPISPTASPGPKPLRKGMRIALDQAVACLPTAPDGSAPLVRKAVQMAITQATAKGAGWNGRLDTLVGSGSITDLGARAARRANALGDWAAHVARGLTPQGARECLEYGRIALSELRFDVSGFGDDAERDRLKRYIQYVTQSRWDGPREFDALYIGNWLDGGLIDVLFACPSCGGEVLVEDLEVPAPFLAGDSSESESDQSMDGECPVCGSTYELIATSRVEGWFVNVTAQERLKGGGSLDAGNASITALPPPWHYLFRVTMDRGDRERFSEELPVDQAG